MCLCLPWEVAVVEEDKEGLPARGEKWGVWELVSLGESQRSGSGETVARVEEEQAGVVSGKPPPPSP